MKSTDQNSRTLVPAFIKHEFNPFTFGKTRPKSATQAVAVQPLIEVRVRPRTSPARIEMKKWNESSAIIPATSKVTTLQLIAAIPTASNTTTAPLLNEEMASSQTVAHKARQPAIPASHNRSDAHTRYCAGTLPNRNYVTGAPNPASLTRRRSKAAVINALLDIKQRRSKNPAGVSNITQIANLSNRGPGWWWKDSNWPVKSWQSIVGVEDEKNVIKAAVMWPSKKAAPGKMLRSIECRTGLTAAGSASEDRILEVDRSQGILRKNKDGTIKPFDKPFPPQERTTIQHRSTRHEGPNTFYRIINDDEGAAKYMPIRRDIIAVQEPRTLKTLKPITNNRYKSNNGWAIDTGTCVEPLPSSKYYCNEAERFNLASWEDREASVKRLHAQQKLLLIRDKNALGK